MPIHHSCGVGDVSFLHFREMYDVCCDNNKYTFPLRCQDRVEDLKQCTRTAVADPALIRAVAAEYLLERVGHVTRASACKNKHCVLEPLPPHGDQDTEVSKRYFCPSTSGQRTGPQFEGRVQVGHVTVRDT